MIYIRYIPSLIILFFFIACGNLKKSDKELQKDWKFLDEEAYSIKYPPSWAVNQSGYEGTSFLLISKQISIRDFYQENVSLYEKDLSNDSIDLQSYVQQELKELQDSVIHFDLLESQQQVAGEDIFYKVIYTGIEIKHKVTVEKHYRIKNKKAYILSFSCKSLEIKRYKPVGEGILNSFKLK